MFPEQKKKKRKPTYVCTNTQTTTQRQMDGQTAGETHTPLITEVQTIDTDNMVVAQ